MQLPVNQHPKNINTPTTKQIARTAAVDNHRFLKYAKLYIRFRDLIIYI